MTCLVSIIQLFSYYQPLFSSPSFSNYLTIFQPSNSLRIKDLLHQPSPKSSKPPISPSFTTFCPRSSCSQNITTYPQHSPLTRYSRTIVYHPSSYSTSFSSFSSSISYYPPSLATSSSSFSSSIFYYPPSLATSSASTLFSIFDNLPSLFTYCSSPSHPQPSTTK